MPDHLNLFEPYRSKEAHHEDALTRAFLLVIRGVPLAHAAWLSLVDNGHRANGGDGLPPLHELGTPSLQTQVGRVQDDVVRVVSLVQTDETYFRAEDASRSDRRQVLDGVISYGGGLAIVMENKPFRGHIWPGQLDVALAEGVEHDRRTACVTWKDVVSAWSGLLDGEYLGPAEALLVGDFLEYVEHYFPRLRPYATIAQCGTDLRSLHRRCEALLRAVGGASTISNHRSWGWTLTLPPGQSVKQIGLVPRGTEPNVELVLELYAGDTTYQARKLYSSIGFSAIKSLSESGWEAKPYFHLMSINTGIFWASSPISLEQYWSFWASNREHIKQWSREQFDAAFELLLSNGIVGANQRAAWDAKTSGTQRTKVMFCPGVMISWRLTLARASALEQRGELEATIRGAIAQATDELKLTLSA